MKIFYYSCDLLYTAAQLWFILQIAKGLFERKAAGKEFYIVQAVTVSVQLWTYWFNAFYDQVLFSNNFMMQSAVVTAAAAAVLYECRFRDAFCFNTLGFTSLALADFFMQTCAYLGLGELGLQENVLLSFGYERGWYLLAWAAFLAAAAKPFRRWLEKNRAEVLRYRRQGYALLLSLLVCMVYFQRIYLEVASGQLLGHWFLFLLCNAVMALALWLNLVKNRVESENQIRQMKLEMLEGNYHALQAVYRERATLVHDMRNHLRVIGEMLETEERERAKAYIWELTDCMMCGESIAYTNHEALDLVLTMKFQEAREAGIEVCWQCDDMSGLALTFVEVCALFSNLLDNAIEANKKCPVEAGRRIDFSCKRKEEMLAVTVSNPVAEEPERRRSGELVLATTKQERALHGFGIPSIQNVLDHHSGYMKTEVKDHTFRSVIYLSAFSW